MTMPSCCGSYVHWMRLGGTAGFPAAEAADVAVRTADWMLASLGLPAGSWGAAGPQGAAEALASSLDADSVVNGEHHEGASYLWTAGELEQVLGADDAAAVAWIMNVGAAGTVSELGSPLHPGGRWPRGAAAALGRRAAPASGGQGARPQPARDDKVVAAGTGLPWRHSPKRGRSWAGADLVAAAVRIAATSSGSTGGQRPGAQQRGNSSAFRTPVQPSGIGGLLEDYAFCAEGFPALYSVTGDAHWYGLAEALISAACRRFVADGSLADTAGESAQVSNALGGRPGLDPFDGATPSGAAAFAGVLLSYAALSGSSEHRTMAGNILALLPPIAAQAPRVAGWLLATAQAAAEGPVEAAVVGRPGAARDALHGRCCGRPVRGWYRRGRWRGRRRAGGGRRDGRDGAAAARHARPERTAHRSCISAAAWSASGRWRPCRRSGTASAQDGDENRHEMRGEGEHGERVEKFVEAEVLVADVRLFQRVEDGASYVQDARRGR